jgi:hypothetical protein
MLTDQYRNAGLVRVVPMDAAELAASDDEAVNFGRRTH